MIGTLYGVAIAAAVLVGSHFVLSAAPVRRPVVGSIGERFFLTGYSIIAIVAIVWLVVAYDRAPYQTLWPEAAWARWAMLALGFVATLMLVAGLTAPNPTAVGVPGSAMARAGAGAGIFAITRHPVMWGIALWALGHVLVNGDTASVIFFGALLALALGGTLHSDARRRMAGGEGWRRFAAVTSWLPFAALIAGRTSWKAAHVAPWRVAVGIAVYALILYAHAPVIGRTALP